MTVKRAYLVAALAVLSAGLAARADVLQVQATFSTAAWGNSAEGTYLNTLGGTHIDNTSASVWSFTNATESLVKGPGTGNSGELDGAINATTSTPTPLLATQASLTTALGTSFNGVCIDALHTVDWNTPYTWTVDSLQSMVGQNLPASTGGNGITMAQAQVNAIAALWNSHYVTSGMNASDAAAFQMAVWDVIYADNSGTIVDAASGYTGAVTSSTDATTAASWAQTALNNGADASNMYMLWGNGTTQDFNFAIVSSSAVPLPSSVGMGLSMLAALGCLFGVRKRLHRSTEIV